MPARHAKVKDGTIERHADRRPVFESKSGGRGRYFLLALVVVLIAGIVGITQAERMAKAPPYAPLHNASVDFPLRLSQAMKQCAFRPGTKHFGNIPLIGTGTFRRVVEVRQLGSVLEAFEPFTRAPLHELTRLDEEEVTRTGCGYAIDLYGTIPDHTLALTFDDGPNPTWTSQLLAVQRGYAKAGYRVPYTFFTIGEEVLKYPGTLREELAQGNVVGDHTLDHPQMSTKSSAQAREELVATARILRKVGHYSPPLFRLPYGGSDADSVRDDVYGILVAQQLGMPNAGFGDDSDDFSAKYSKPKAVIPPLTLTGAGQVVVMHDGGGNRQATVRFAEQTIRQALEQGYHFVTLPELLPKASLHGGAVQPKAADYLSYYRYYGEERLSHDWILAVFLLCTIAAGLVSLAMMVLAIRGARKVRRREAYWHDLGEREHYWPRATMLIAANNEQETIARTTRHALASDYPEDRLGVVVVNDGSTDDTGVVVENMKGELVEAGQSDRLVHIEVPNGGKSEALNRGLYTLINPEGELVVPLRRGPGGKLFAAGDVPLPAGIGPQGKLIGPEGWRWHLGDDEIVVLVDADTIVEPQTVTALTRPFIDLRVEMVVGTILISNEGKGLVQKAVIWSQWVEYLVGQGFRRAAESALDAIGNVPGALMAMRASTLRALGGFPVQASKAEDTYIRFLLAEWGGRGALVVQSFKAVAHTEAPATIAGLAKQWERWSTGTLQTLWAFRGMVLRPWHYGPLGWLVIPYSGLSFVVSAVFVLCNYVLSGLAIAEGRGVMVLMYLAFFTLLQQLMLVVAMINLRQFKGAALLGSLYHRFVIDATTSNKNYHFGHQVITGRLRGWNRVERTGEVKDSLKKPADDKTREEAPV
jgi:cellulose synthase/poly-beta-1,6-N-acetylglucosamine synthase-like glycosyltransferase/peptidoglycan/xylan/chitin deacetylase (PgdA/CDA1 family)